MSGLSAPGGVVSGRSGEGSVGGPTNIVNLGGTPKPTLTEAEKRQRKEERDLKKQRLDEVRAEMLAEGLEPTPDEVEIRYRFRYSRRLNTGNNPQQEAPKSDPETPKYRA